MKYLITGTGRCGTGYISKVLSSAGVNCTHEQVFTPQGLEYAREQIALRDKNPWWGWKAEASWLAAPFLGDECLKDTVIVHLVRDPKKTMDSLLRMWFFTHPQYDVYYRLGRKFLPEVDNWESPEEKAAFWYLGLNQMIEPYADVFHRVEDPVTLLLDDLGIEHEGMDLYRNQQYNHRVGYGASDVDLNALPEPLKSQLKRMSARYGYSWPKEVEVKHASRWRVLRRKVERFFNN